MCEGLFLTVFSSFWVKCSWITAEYVYDNAAGEACFSFLEVIVADDANDGCSYGIGDEVCHGVL